MKNKKIKKYLKSIKADIKLGDPISLEFAKQKIKDLSNKL